jgi:hypothetical protein
MTLDIEGEDLVHYEGYGTRPRSLRAHWVNCCLEPDGEIIEIDHMEDRLDPKEREQAQGIRRLITRFEVCHWNSDRWLERIVQAIGEGRVPPTSGRPRAQHPLAQMLICLQRVLACWVARATTPIPQCIILEKTGAEILHSLGTWTPFKAWVVQRLLDGLEHHLRVHRLLPPSELPPARSYSGDLNLDSPNADPYFPDSLDWLAEARSRKLKTRKEIGDKVQEHSLAMLISSPNPCNEFYFRFLFALFEYLDDPENERILPSPFCGNVSLARHRRYGQAINALRAYLGQPPEGSLPLDDTVLSQLGEPNPAKRWLAASLEKTLREQLPPAPEPV